jgi:hypothetical protein
VEYALFLPILIIGILFRHYVSTFALESNQYGLVCPYLINKYKRKPARLRLDYNPNIAQETLHLQDGNHKSH